MRDTLEKHHNSLSEVEQDNALLLDRLRTYTGRDFRGLLPEIAQRQINTRMCETGCETIESYLELLESSPSEALLLTHSLTINVSSFFRNPLVFAYLRQIVLPHLLAKKIKRGEHSLRVWSAGCASGEEPYSIALVIHELLEKDDYSFQVNIFGTDIDMESLEIARAGEYEPDKLDNVPLQYLKSYFVQQNDRYLLDPVIRNMVVFSEYNLLDEKSRVPQISVFGDFDLAFCCNVAMYYRSMYQTKIFSKVSRSIIHNGYLVLGEAEELPLPFRKSYITLPGAGHLYQKR